MIQKKDRGVRKTASQSIASGSGLTTSTSAVLTGVDDKILIVDRVYFQYPTDVTAWDMSLKVNGIVENGSAREVFRIDDAGTNGPTDLRAVFDFDVPNPPSGMVYGYLKLPNAILDGSSDTIGVVGNDGTAANNYTSTGATAMQVTVAYREIDKATYMRNIT